VIAFTVSVTAILLAAHSLSPMGRSPRTLAEEIISWVSLLWLGAFLPGSLGLIGTLLYRFPSDLDDIRPINRMICWRIVTAGKNIDIVLLERGTRGHENLVRRATVALMTAVKADPEALVQSRG
jgi:hypothetical protein